MSHKSKCLLHGLKKSGSLFVIPKANIDFVYDVGMQSPCLRRKVKLDEYVPLNRYQKIRACTKKKKKQNYRVNLILKIKNTKLGG